MKSILGCLAFVLFVAVSMFISHCIVRFSAKTFAEPDYTKWEEVYVSESPNAHRFHCSSDCKALKKTSYNIELLTVEEAEVEGFEPCQLCLKESCQHQWDEWVVFIFIPVSCLVYFLLGKVWKFIKKYKFAGIVRNDVAEDRFKNFNIDIHHEKKGKRCIMQKKWIFLVASPVIVVFLMILCFSRPSKDVISQESEIGKYVFIDDGTCHLDIQCPFLRRDVRPIDTLGLILEKDFKICSKCVTIDQYEHLKAISSRNEREKLIKEDREWLYHTLINFGYKIGPYDDFIRDMAIEGYRRNLYTICLNEKLKVGDSFDEFSDLSGF